MAKEPSEIGEDENWSPDTFYIYVHERVEEIEAISKEAEEENDYDEDGNGDEDGEGNDEGQNAIEGMGLEKLPHD
jgi:hypothetical protein